MRFFYKLAPVILLVVSLVLWMICFVLDQSSIFSSRIIWMPFVITETVISVICGFVIRRLYHGFNQDALTGLGNRRYFYDKLNKEIERVKRSNFPLSLVFIDVDDFKKINDNFGHLVGDRVLQQLAAIMKKSCRTIDTTVRWGGEEFVIILPGTPVEGATSFAERLRVNVEQYDFSCPVTISIGISVTNCAVDIDQFVKKADNALYSAKERKNVVVVA